MDQDSTDHLNQSISFDALFRDTDNVAAVNFNSAFHDEKLLFDADLILSKECAVRANASADGITFDKDAAKTTASRAFAVTCGFAHSFFIKKGNEGKQKEYEKYTENYFFTLKDADFVSKTASVHLDLLDFVPDIVSIPFFDATILTADMVLQTTFSNWMGKWAVKENAINAAKKEYRDTWTKKMDVHYDFMEGLLGKLTGFSSFVESFIVILDMVHTGHRNMGVQISATNSVDGSFIKQMEIHFDDYAIVGKKDVTNNMGESPSIRLITGQWNMVFLHPLFHSKSEKVIVKRKFGVIHVEVVLIPL
ncbi:MAG: hypothetical protein WCL14_07640 [Bacteroidota bacterium]